MGFTYPHRFAGTKKVLQQTKKQWVGKRSVLHDNIAAAADIEKSALYQTKRKLNVDRSVEEAVMMCELV